MVKVTLFRKISFYRAYKKAIKANAAELESIFNIRIDDANRLFTVLNIPDEIIGEAYSLKKSDIDRISDNFIRNFTGELGKYLNSKGIAELYDMYELRKVGKYSYLVIVGFSMFRSDERRGRLFKYWLPAGVIVGLSLLLSIFLAL